MHQQELNQRFQTTASAVPYEDRTETQQKHAEIATAVERAAYAINTHIADGRAKSVALTELESALMWAGKALYYGTRTTN